MVRLHEVISREVSKVRNLTSGSRYYGELIQAGVDQVELDSFIESGCQLKRGPGDRACGPDVEKLLDMGGSVAGGGALAAAFRTHKTNDFDVFFCDPISYVKGILLARDNRRVDVCFYVGRPYDSFDLAISKCSVSRAGVDIHEDCVRAIETGVSDLCPDAIVNADATLRRMLKYHGRLGIRFKSDQVLAMCSVFGVSKDLARRVLTTCVAP